MVPAILRHMTDAAPPRASRAPLAGGRLHHRHHRAVGPAARRPPVPAALRHPGTLVIAMARRADRGEPAAVQPGDAVVALALDRARPGARDHQPGLHGAARRRSRRRPGERAGSCCWSRSRCWITNVIAFAIVYWELDDGGPVQAPHGADGTDLHEDFLFPQEQVEQLAALPAARSSTTSTSRCRP